MPMYTDQLGNTIQLPGIPQRIVSLVPSQTELLYDLGLDEQVVGITKFCVHPSSWHRSKTRVGGTKNLDLERIRQLKPDLIIANKEENIREQVAPLQSIAPVWVSDVETLEDALSMIGSVGDIAGTQQKAAEIIAAVGRGFGQLSINKQVGAVYLIWKEPYMTVGGDTFIHDLMERAGFINVFGRRRRYPEVSIDEIKQSGCEMVLLSSEPYPFRQQHVAELQLLLPGQKIILVDGEMFSWYGSRLLKAPGYFSSLQA